MEHEVLYDKHANPNAVLKVLDNGSEFVAVDLFPYKVKDRELFYQRDHPEQLHPESEIYDNYWGDFEKKCIEGTWVEDKDGTWVFMPPKLFYFINYVTIVSETRTRIKPWLRDIEWIIHTYWLCVEGFSGFEDDTRYTSHYLAKKAHEETLDDIEKKRIPPSCYYKGELKEYIDPWTFLTRTYLIDEPRGPLGRPLYSPTAEDKSKPLSGLLEEYNRKNCAVLTSRGLGKSITFFQAILMHEFTFSGVRYMEDLENTGRQLIMSTFCGTKPQLQRSLNTIKSFYDNQPGKFRFQDSNEPDYMGALYKNYQGGFLVGKAFQHVIKDSMGNIDHFGSTVQSNVLGPDSATIAAGDRQRMILIEEWGFVGDTILEFYDAVKDTIALFGKQVGSFVGIGTAGSMDKIKGPKKMFEDPSSFNIFSIPNYWENPKKNIGLFIPVLYQYRDYEDKNGHVNVKLALEYYIRKLQKDGQEMDSVQLASSKMYNPLIPRDMLIPNTRSLMPKREAQHQLSDIDTYGLYKTHANCGELVFDKYKKYGVRFEKDMDNYDRVIQETNPNFDKINKEGRFVMFESPAEYIPDYTYFVCFDPTKPKDDDGTSLNGVIVYKHFNANGGWLTDGIAAVWAGRMGSLDENYEQVIKIAKFFNATIFVETNTGGFVKWCRERGHFDMLQRDSYALEKELAKNPKRNYHKVGCEMTGRKKEYAIKALRDWLNEVRHRDEVTGVPIKRNINYIFSKKLLNEVIDHKPDGNFDLLSAMLLLMILFSQFSDLDPGDEGTTGDPWDDGPTPIISDPRVAQRRQMRRYSSRLERL